MFETRGEYLKIIMNNLMIKGVWPALFIFSVIFLLLGINKPDVSFSTFTSVMYIGFLMALAGTIYFVYKE